jgi:CubicO group peptidase (beta-lactamase class C family)
MRHCAKIFHLWLILLFAGLLSSCGIVRSVMLMTPNSDDYRRDPQIVIEAPPNACDFYRATGFQDPGKSIRVTRHREAEKIDLDAFVQLYGTEAFLIVRNDTILYEVYANGHSPDQPVSSFSIAKAVMTTLTGIAIHEGVIQSLDQRVCEILPDWGEKGFPNLTIRDLLQHTSGMNFTTSIYNPASDQVQFYYGRNLQRRMQRRKPVSPPGEAYDYQSANTILLSMVLEKATGKPIAEYLETRLWIPLGMESPASWSLDRRGKKGLVRTFCCLQAHARDFARLGRLWLNNGHWPGQPFLPPEFMPQILHDPPESPRRYRHGFRVANDPTGIFYASGLLGQYIYVFPEKDLIILRFGEHRERYSGQMWRSIFMEIAGQL